MTQISHHLIAELTGLQDLTPFLCDTLGLVDSNVPKTLSYVASSNFIDEANKNENVEAVITCHEFAKKISKRKILILYDDPVWLFWTLFNRVSCDNEILNPTIIHSTTKIHPSAYISEFGVNIGENTIVEPNVTIHAHVSIGKNCVIRSGTVCGFDGFEHKKTEREILSIRHNGSVTIENGVEIGTLNSIARGFSWKNTIISSNTKTDSLVHIAHGVNIGRNCLITACAEISGSVDIGDNCWLSPNCSIINGVSIGENSLIGIGAVVTKSFPENVVVTGNPAKILRISRS